jgi:WD40 repeat protein
VGRTEDKLRLFISYSRANAVAADAIVAALEAENFEVSIDRRSLPYGEEWQNQLLEMIRAADTVVWLVSPASNDSDWCKWELGRCTELSKRVVPVRIEPLDPARLPPDLRKIHILPAEGIYQSARDLPKLVETLNTDYAWLKESTRLADRARQWSAKGSAPALLLGGAALVDAEKWSNNRPLRAEPSKEILDYLHASRKRAGQRQRWAIGGAMTVAAIAGSLAIAAFVQRQAAIAQRDAAVINQSRLLAESAYQAVSTGDAATGLLLALSGLPNHEEGQGRPEVTETENMLLSGILNLHERQIFDGRERAALSADRSLVAYAKSDNEIQVAEVATRRDVALLTHPAAVGQVSFSPDGSRLLTEADHVLRIWDIRSGRALIALKNASGFGDASFSADGERLLLSNGSQSGDAHGVMVWDSAKLQRTLLLRHPAHVSLAAFSPDGQFIVTASDDNRVRIFNAKAGTAQATIETKADRLSFSADGAYVVTCLRQDRGNIVQFWGVADGALARTVRLESGGEYDAVNLSRDAKRIVTNDWEKNIVKIWGIEGSSKEAQDLLTLKAQIKVLTRGVAYGPVSAEFDGSGDGVVTTHRDDTARVWSLRPYPVKEFDAGCEVSRLLPSADGALLVTHCADQGAVKVWNGHTGELRRDLNVQPAEIGSVLLSPDGTMIAGLGKNGTAHIWSAQDGREVAALAHGSEISTGVFDQKGTKLATAGKDGTIKIWQRTSATSQEWNATPVALPTSRLQIARLVFSPNGDRVLSLLGDRSAQIWDAANGSLRATMLPSDTKPTVYERSDGTIDTSLAACAFSPDGRYVATERSGRTYLWDAETGTQLASTLTTHGTPIMRLAFSKDSRRLISGGIEWAIWIGEVPTGRTVKFVDTSSYNEFAYHPESEILATGDTSGVQLNDAVTGRQIAMLEGRDAGALSVSADGTHLFAAEFEGSRLRVWSLPQPGVERVRLARELVPRCLTPLQLGDAGLEPSPPRWCITGPAHVGEKDPSKWDGKWPYRTTEWRDWLAARDRGESPGLPIQTQGGPPPPDAAEPTNTSGSGSSRDAGNSSSAANVLSKPQ